MKIKVGVMGSATETQSGDKEALTRRAEDLGRVIASRDLVLMTGATTGVVYVVGKAMHDDGGLHVGVSPAHNSEEHIDVYKLPVDACDVVIYTGFGLKGRNVVLVRSCDIVLFIAGGMGSLNEFTIAHDERKVIGCLLGTGGVADEADLLLQKFSKVSGARIFQDEDPKRLLDACIDAIESR
jgi:uncharacterized protein (TIGR00725 family)